MIVTIAILMMLGVPGWSEAQDDNGLYGAGVPQDAGLVRIVNAVSDQPLRSVWVGATRFDAVERFGVTPYRPVAPGIHQVMIAGQSEELIPQRGGYYSVILWDRGLSILPDRAHTRPDRSQIFLYNLSDVGAVELRTGDGATTVIPAVAAGESGVVEVNPIAIELALYHGGAIVEPIGDLGLQRGQSYSVFLFGSGAATRTVIVQAAIDLE